MERETTIITVTDAIAAIKQGKPVTVSTHAANMVLNVLCRGKSRICLDVVCESGVCTLTPR